MMTVDSETAVRALLDAAGVSPSPEELAALIAAYPSVRERADALHALARQFDEEPAVLFRADL
jgi:hypothetical protein